MTPEYDISQVPEEDRRRILVLGCGTRPIHEATNHDLVMHHDYVDMAFDLNHIPWPIDDNEYMSIVAEDVLEHLNSFLDFFNECWRILDEEGMLVVQTVSWRSENRWRDPTHIRPYHADAFCYLDPDTTWGRKYGFYTDKKWHIETLLDEDNIFVVLRKRVEC